MTFMRVISILGHLALVAMAALIIGTSLLAITGIAFPGLLAPLLT